MIDKAYVELTNVCNLKCDFCAGHRRTPKFMTVDELERVLSKLDNKVEYLYLHLMGEPLIHPRLEDALMLCDKHSFKVILTTNGTMLSQKAASLLKCKSLYKISLSLHSAEGCRLDVASLDHYLDNAFDFADISSRSGIITVFRLWNEENNMSTGEFDYNLYIIKRLHDRFDTEWKSVRCGSKLRDKLYLEFGERFSWPESDSADKSEKCTDCFCYALRDQFGVLADGTVVPCCLDHDGVLALGNIFDSELDTILSSEKAKKIYDGFSRRTAVYDYCKSCRRPKPH